jgi:predicted nucleic acid-binding Zn ribbon protein
MSQKARYNHTRTVSEAFENFLDAFGIREKYDEAFINTNWEQLMGKTIAKRTQKVYLKKKILYLDISSPALRQDLILSKSKMVTLINAEYGREIVKEIMFL